MPVELLSAPTRSTSISGLPSPPPPPSEPGRTFADVFPPDGVLNTVYFASILFAVLAVFLVLVFSSHYLLRIWCRRAEPASSTAMVIAEQHPWSPHMSRLDDVQSRSPSIGSPSSGGIRRQSFRNAYATGEDPDATLRSENGSTPVHERVPSWSPPLTPDLRPGLSPAQGSTSRARSERRTPNAASGRVPSGARTPGSRGPIFI